jgi:glycosyltransferase involved in cell wall biosynthesis
MANISFAITACNEHIELERLLKQLDKNIKKKDEIVVQLDITATQEVKDIVSKYKLINYIHPLNNDFATFKNNLKSICTNEWIFFIDADEYLSDDLLFNIHEILDANKGIVDVISVPRINTVDGLTREHIDKWRWFVDENGYVNYPDYQTRICTNKPNIEWVNKVHERLIGWKTIANLPYGYDLIHPKTIERQERQNNYYNTI